MTLRLRALNQGLADGEPTPESAIDAQLRAAHDARSAAWEPVLLLATPEVIARGRTWHQACWNLGDRLRAQDLTPDQWARIFVDLGLARDAFYAAVREDLGLL